MHSSQRFTVITIVLFIAVLLAGIFYVKPLYDGVSSLQAGRDEKQAQKDDLTRQLSDLQHLQQSLQSSTEVGRQTSLNAIPERFEQDKLILDLTAIAKSNDVVLNAVNFNVPTASLDKVKRATIDVNLTSDDAGLTGFLKGIEGNERKILVKSITVQSGKVSTGNTPRVNFSLNMETYFQEKI